MIVHSGSIHDLVALGYRGYLPPRKSSGGSSLKPGRPPEDERGREPDGESGHHYQGYVDSCWPIHHRRREQAVKNGSPDRLTGEIRTHHRHLGSNTEGGDAEFHYIDRDGVFLCITMENPHLNTPDLEALAVGYYGEERRDGEENPNVKRIRDCGASCKWDCAQHGTKMTGQVECRLHYCPNCLTDLARDLDRARLPDIDPESGAAYRSVWLVGRYSLPEHLPEWELRLGALMKEWDSSLVRVQRRKSTRGAVLWRSFTVYYTLNEAWVHWKVMLKEDHPGHADDVVAELCTAMDAEVYDDRRYVHGELGSLQLIENARTHLLGFSQDIDWEEKFELFTAHLDATRGRHVFQGMGALWSLLRALPEPEPLVCDECGAPLHRVVERDSGTCQPPPVPVPPGRPPPGGGWGHGGVK